MKAGEFADGAHVLRAKIDMAHPNMIMRDPLLLRIRHAPSLPARQRLVHLPALRLRARALSDAIEGITHSLCTLEFKDNRDIYDWLVREAGFEQPPEQTEFARLELDYTVLSKRKLLRLVNDGHVNGWDDPRMPTIAGMRRRGVTPEAIRAFCRRRSAWRARMRGPSSPAFEHAVRNDLNMRVPRVLCVVKPLKVVLTNYPEGQVERARRARTIRTTCRKTGSRTVPFSRELWIDRDDFMEDPPKKFFRLAPGREVRLRYGYLITCTGGREGRAGNVVELRCTYDPGHPRRQRARRPQGAGHDPLGLGARTRSTARCGCTTGSSRSPIPTRCPRGRTSRRRSIRTRWSSVHGRQGRAECGEGSDGDAVSVRAHRLLHSRCRSIRRPARWSSTGR